MRRSLVALGAILLVTSLLIPGRARAASGLAELNGLTQLIAPKGEVAPADLDRLLEVARAIALRDATIGITPEAIGYAAALEKLVPRAGKQRTQAERVLLDLSLAMARFSGPEREALTAPFYAELLRMRGLKPADSKARPNLPRELAEIGRWANATATRLIATLPSAEAEPLRARLDFLAGRYGELAALAKRGPRRAQLSPLNQAWLAAALLGEGKRAEPHLSFALAAGGEASEIAIEARRRRDWQLAAAAAPRLLRAAGITVLPPSSGGKPGAIEEACRTLVDHAASPALAKAVEPCAVLLMGPPAAWFAKAAPLAPAGPAGAPVRAMAELHALSDAKKSSPSAWASYRAEVKSLELPEIAKSELLLAHYLLRAPAAGADAAPDAADHPLFDTLRRAPCDARSLPFTILVTRDAERPGALDEIIKQCAAEPGGVAATAHAFELLLARSVRSPSSQPGTEPLEPRIRAFAAAHPDDPNAIATHADAIALSAFAGGHANPIALEAALARYDEAIARATPASGAVTLARLQSNAADLSLTLAELLGKRDANAWAQFTARAAHHLRYALVFGLKPATAAVRARYETFTGTGAPEPGSVAWLAKLPADKGRARVACLLAAEATARGDHALADKLRPLASGAEATSPARPEALFESAITFGAELGTRALHPIVYDQTLLYLVPTCDAAALAAAPAPPKAPAR